MSNEILNPQTNEAREETGGASSIECETIFIESDQSRPCTVWCDLKDIPPLLDLNQLLTTGTVGYVINTKQKEETE